MFVLIGERNSTKVFDGYLFRIVFLEEQLVILLHHPHEVLSPKVARQHYPHSHFNKMDVIWQG